MAKGNCVIFEYKGKFGHFLRAEANVSAPSYPFPPRTSLLGLAGAVLGLDKDTPQILLRNADFAVSGGVEGTHWHTANFRKYPPAPLSLSVKKRTKGDSRNQSNTFVTQEWLYKPKFTVYAHLPKPFHEEFCERIRNRSWHFSPCLGLSEMMADLVFINSVGLEPLEEGDYGVETVLRKSHATLDMNRILESRTMLKSIRVPRDVSEERRFSHESYLYEVNGKPLHVKTAHAFRAGGHIIQWL